jgi:hypothetical protein
MQQRPFTTHCQRHVKLEQNKENVLNHKNGIVNMKSWAMSWAEINVRLLRQNTVNVEMGISILINRCRLAFRFPPTAILW